jgi:phage shock protein PspC (stress-responsive transcriptional regulator)
MKKNISINISGIIFHIEEDGYEKLKEYLETIHKYFSTYDDSTEITADIENRIAEIFLSKLKEGKQVITLEDVDALIATMGGIKDFKEVEVEQEAAEDKKAEAGSPAGQGSTAYQQPRRLFRDEKRKILGGVIAGVAHHFTIDPLWIRLVFLVLFFGVWIAPAVPGILILTYIILWIVIPGSYEISDEKKYKKMYRNPDGKVLGGVASGIAAYFGVDVVIIRLLFIILIFFGGTGLILYIIFWIILPEATTITDKMEMQGEPVTLRNIETNIKKSLKVEGGQEESIWVKILLFPFRLIASLIEFLSKALGPFLNFFVEAIRVAFGLILVLTSIALLIALVVVGGIGLGLFTNVDWISMGSFPIDVFTKGIPVLPLIAVFFASLIPVIFLIILGISIITKQLMLNAKIGWGLFALWIISLVLLAFTVPKLIMNFGKEGTITEVENYDFGKKTMVLKLHESGMENYEMAVLKLRGQDEPNVRLEKRFEARGNSRANAIENAKMVEYDIVRNDSVLTFDSNIRFRDGASFRGQTLSMTLFIPYDKPFMMEEDLKYILRNTIYSSGYSVSQLQGNTWTFTHSGLKCITCKEDSSERSDRDEEFNPEGYNREFKLDNFTSINAGGIFSLNIVQAPDTKIVVSGNEEYVDKVEMRVDGDELIITLKDKITHWNRNMKEIVVDISVPELKHLKLGGAAKAKIEDFDQDQMELDLTGASNAELNAKVKSLNIGVEGASKISLEGEGDNLTVKASGASSINGFDYEAKSIDIEVSGASNAKVNATEELEADASGFGKIQYRGEPRLNVHGSGLNSISKED